MASLINTWAPRFAARAARAWRPAVITALTLLVALAAPATSGAEGLDVTTPYPAVAVAPGSDVTFELSVRTARAGRVNLAVQGVPEGWTATIRGGGFVVDGVQTTPGEDSNVSLEVSVPPTASGTQQIVVRATDGQLTTDLPLSLRIEAAAAGDVTLTSEFPSLRGPSDVTFPFKLDLSNDTPEDLTFVVEAQAPDGWEATARVAGQQQAASATVEGGSNVSIDVDVTPPQSVAAGTYPITVSAASGARTTTADLQVEITGSYSITLTTPNDRLNVSGTAGGEIRQTLVIQNTGTAAVDNLALTSDAKPTGWTVDFEPAEVSPIEPGKDAQVTAVIRPSGDAIAGDYLVSVTAANDNAEATQELRVTVETSILWGLIGLALIVAVFAGLWWVFQRYGRR